MPSKLTFNVLGSRLIEWPFRWTRSPNSLGSRFPNKGLAVLRFEYLRYEEMVESDAKARIQAKNAEIVFRPAHRGLNGYVFIGPRLSSDRLIDEQLSAIGIATESVSKPTAGRRNNIPLVEGIL